MSDLIALARCLQDEAAAAGFDWPDADGVLDKLDEEWRELRGATGAAEQQEEFGDLLFVLINLSRHLQIDPEAALNAAIEKFRQRYAYVIAEPESLPPLGDPGRLDEMERRWQEAKRRERHTA